MNIDLMYISIYSILLPSVFGVVLFNKLVVPLKILVLFSVTTLCMELISIVFFSKGENNLWLYHLYTYLEYAFISVIFWLIMKHKRAKRLILPLGIIFLIASILNLIYLESINGFNSYQKILEYGFLCIILGGYAFDEAKNAKTPFIENSPYFILTAGLLLYLTGTLFLFIMLRSIVDQEKAANLWAIHQFLNIILNIIYTIVLWKGSKVSKLL